MRKVALDPLSQQCPPCPSSPALLRNVPDLHVPHTFLPACDRQGFTFPFTCVCSECYMSVCSLACVWGPLDADVCMCVHICVQLIVCMLMYACNQLHRHVSVLLCLCQNRGFPKATQRQGVSGYISDGAQLPPGYLLGVRTRSTLRFTLEAYGGREARVRGEP